MAVNKVILLGNLGKDPELRVTTSQMQICNFSLATSEKRKDASGQWTEQTEWHNIVTFGTVAQNCAKYLKKGRQVFIEGRIQTRKWQDKEGKDRYSTEIIANTVQFVGNKGDSGGSGYDAPSQDESPDPAMTSAVFGSLKPANTLSGGGDISFDDDDIPF